MFRTIKCGALAAFLMLGIAAPLTFTSCENAHPEINFSMESDFSGIIKALNDANTALADKLANIEAAVKEGTLKSSEALDAIKAAVASMEGTVAQKLAAIESAVKDQTTSFETKMALLETALSEGFASVAEGQDLMKQALESLEGTVEDKLAAVEEAVKDQTLSLETKLEFFKLPDSFAYFCLQLAIAVVFLIFSAYILRRRRRGQTFGWISVVSTSIASILCILAVVIYGAVTPKDAHKYIDATINGKDNVYESVSEDNFFRVDISENCDNYPMFWELPCMRCFQSVVSTSIMDFYDNIGVQRDVASRADISHYTLRSLLSVKYFYREIRKGYSYEDIQAGISPPSSSESTVQKFDIEASKVDITKYLTGFKYIGSNDHFEIYENELYIPMGFSYDTYVPESEAEDMSDTSREKLLIKALILNDEQIAKYDGIIEKMPPAKAVKLTKSDYSRFCREKQENCADSFSYDSHGFRSEITLESSKLVFFSVPYSSGWTAKVNGKPVDVEKVSYGFMAVKGEEGKNDI